MDAPVASFPAPRHTCICLRRLDNCETFEYRGVYAVNSAFRDIQQRSDNIQGLVARPLPLPALATIDAMLPEDLPALEDLELRVDIPEDDPDTVQAIHTLNLNLPPSRLPNLSTLVLLNSAAHISAPIASHLYRLRMINPPGCANTLPLLPFVHCLHYIDQLADLVVRNCFSPASAEDPVGCPPVMGRLQWVTIEDYPVNISHMLGAFILQSNTDTNLIANLRGAPIEQVLAAFTTMLPRDRDCLPVLQKITDLSVHCSSDFAQIVGKVAWNPGHLSLEVITDVSDPPTEADKRDMGDLYESMVRGLGDLFPGAPVEELDFCGDNDYIPRATWAAALDRFPMVRKLEIDMYDIEARGPLNELFATLMKPCWRPQDQLPCQRLDDLTLYGTAGIAPATELWEALKRCFGERKERLGKRYVALRRLWVNLYGGELISNEETAFCKSDMFYGLANERTIVQVYTETHDINDLIIIWDPCITHEFCSIQ